MSGLLVSGAGVWGSWSWCWPAYGWAASWTLGQLAEVQGVWPAGEESQGPWDPRAGGFPLKSEAGSWGL